MQLEEIGRLRFSFCSTAYPKIVVVVTVSYENQNYPVRYLLLGISITQLSHNIDCYYSNVKKQRHFNKHPIHFAVLMVVRQVFHIKTKFNCHLW